MKKIILIWKILLFSILSQAQTITVGTVGPTSFCAGDVVAVPYTITGTFNAGNIFTAQLSDVSGSFASPTNIGTIISTNSGTIAATIPMATPSGTGYRIRVVSSDPAVISSNVSAVLTVTTATGNPAVFGNGEWIAYVFDGNIFNGTHTYKGFYTQTSLTFNSTARWPDLGSPSTANNTGGNPYTGCVVGTDNFSVSYKRTNFTCGWYRIDIYHRDYYEIVIDGVVVASNAAAVAGSTRNLRWRGILGPSSQVEIRWFDTTPNANARLQATFTTLTGVDIIASVTPPAICSSSSAVINLINNASNQTVDFRNYPANYTFSWTGPSGFTAGNVYSITTPAGNAGVYTYTAVHNPTGCTISGSVNVPLAPPPVVSITPAGPITACPAEPNVLTASGAVSYTWSPAAGLNTTTGATVTASPTVTTTYTVTGSDGCTTSTASITINVLPNPSDPGTFGSGEWFVACYQGNNFNRYFGYYTETNLSFNTSTRWGQGVSPSAANAATGTPYTSSLSCAIPNDNHSYTYRRTNFPCGYYRIRIVRNDNQAYLLINGTQVWERLAANSTNVIAWEGFLGATSTVEIRVREGGGSSFLQADISEISATLAPVTSPSSVTICQGSSTTITTDGQPVAARYNTDGTFNSFGASSNISFTQVTGNPGDFTITPSGNNATVTANVTPTPNPATIRVTFTDPLSGCSISRDVSITVDPLPTTSVVATNLVICLGESTTLTASGANTYTWSPAAGLSSTTGHIVTASPTATTTYTVSGNNNCATIDATITITVINPGLTGAEFGTNEWIAHCYNGAIITNPGSAIYRGYYTERSISFNSQTRWAQNQNPTLAAPLGDGSLGYNGCSVNNDNHSVVWKRTNFPCGFYSISVGRDDRYELFVNGVLVASSTTAGFTSIAWSGLLNNTSTVEFRVQESTGNSYGQLSIGFSLGSATTSVWTGEINNDWFNPLNWCPVVPTQNIDAIIPGGGVSNFPIINANGAETRNIQIAIGANLTINSGFALNVHGNYLQEGNLTANTNSLVSILHNATPANATIEVSGTGSFYNLRMDKLGNVVTQLSNIQVNNVLTLENGELNLNNNTLTINNPATNAIMRNNNAYIRSETNAATNNSLICWNTGTSTGAYVFPFGVSASEYIPVSFNKITNAATTICIATRATTGADNTPWATGVTNVTGVSGATAINDVIDRWWNITSSANPLPAPGANVTFRYRGVENTLAAPQTDNIAAQHWNGSDWDAPYMSSSPAVTSGVGSVTAIGLQQFSPFLLVREVRPLPVRLLSFQADARNGFVWLNWQIAQKVNNEVYTIQRSANSRTFEDIGVVRSENQDKYEWIDREPLKGVSYYRLKRQDNLGNVEYSQTEAVNLLALVEEGMTIIPNPSYGETVLIVWQAAPQESATLSITDALGRIVYETPLRTDASGRANTQVRAILAKGLYVAQIRTKDKIHQEKIVVR
ncbi:MAG: hypothetical protein OHK0045_12020 [Raineya sp.]